MESKPKKSLKEWLSNVEHLEDLFFSLGQALAGKELEAASLALAELVIRRKDEFARRNYLGSPEYVRLQGIFPKDLHEKIINLVGEPIYRVPRNYEKLPEQNNP